MTVHSKQDCPSLCLFALPSREQIIIVKLLNINFNIALQEPWGSGLVLVMCCVALTGHLYFLVSEPQLENHSLDDFSSKLHLSSYASNQILARKFWDT